MQLAEPAPTRLDIFFKVGTIPVRIHPLFWVITGILGLISAGQMTYGRQLGSAAFEFPIYLLMWVVAVLLSLLLHELGHGWAARHYGWPPRITMYGMGGVTVYEPRKPTIASRIIIALAGPGAGFAFGALILLGLKLTGHGAHLPGLFVGLDGPMVSGRLGIFILDLLMVNFFWGLLNLMPVQPMDGGTVVQALLEKFKNRTPMRTSFQIGVGTAVALVVLSLVVYHSAFLAVMFAVMGYNNWQFLQSLSRHGF